jgi:hypothetical protein
MTLLMILFLAGNRSTMIGGTTTKGQTVANVKVVTDHPIHVMTLDVDAAPNTVSEVLHYADNLGLRPQSQRIHGIRPQSHHHQWNADIILASPLFSLKMRSPWFRSLTKKDVSSSTTHPKK